MYTVLLYYQMQGPGTGRNGKVYPVEDGHSIVRIEDVNCLNPEWHPVDMQGTAVVSGQDLQYLTICWKHLLDGQSCNLINFDSPKTAVALVT